MDCALNRDINEVETKKSHFSVISATSLPSASDLFVFGTASFPIVNHQKIQTGAAVMESRDPILRASVRLGLKSFRSRDFEYCKEMVD